MEYFARMYGMAGPRRGAALEGVLALTDLEAVADRPTRALSAGVKRRLALAKTLLPDPRILVLDEPAAGLDPRARIEIRALLRELARMGKTIVIASHILADIEEIATDIGIIEEGRLVAGGPLDALKARMSGAVRVEVRVPAEARDRASAILGGLDGVAAIRGSDPFRVELDGRSANDVLEALLREGIEILAFRKEVPSLEDIFLATTRGKVS